jgi:hypothetical protein
MSPAPHPKQRERPAAPARCGERRRRVGLVRGAGGQAGGRQQAGGRAPAGGRRQAGGRAPAGGRRAPARACGAPAAGPRRPTVGRMGPSPRQGPPRPALRWGMQARDGGAHGVCAQHSQARGARAVVAAARRGPGFPASGAWEGRGRAPPGPGPLSICLAAALRGADAWLRAPTAQYAACKEVGPVHTYVCMCTHRSSAPCTRSSGCP